MSIDNTGGRRTDAQAHFAESLNLIIEATKVGLWDWDLTTGEVLYSKEWEAIAGYDEGELPRHVSSWESTLFPDDLDETNRRIERYLAGETDSYVSEFRMVRKDGSVIWAQDRGVVTEWDESGKPIRLIGILQDITRIKQTEEDLRERTELLDYVARMSGLGYWVWDLSTDTIEYSREYFSMLGYGDGELDGSFLEWEALNHPDDLPFTIAALDDYICGRTDEYSQEIRMLHKDGHYVWTLDTGEIVERDENGKPTKILGGHLDIDKLKYTEGKLREALEQNERYSRSLQAQVDEVVRQYEKSRQFSSAMFDASPYMNIIIDEKMRILDCNPAAIEYFGFKDKAEFIEKAFNLIMKSIPDYQPDGSSSISLAERFAYVREHGYIDFETELIIRGERTPIRAILRMLDYEDSYAIAIYMIDLRTIKEAKNELLRQDRLLREVNGAATRLLASVPENFEDAVVKSLEALGKSVEADRIYIWENFTENGRMHCRQIYEWSEKMGSRSAEDFAQSNDYALFPGWDEVLARGMTVNTPVSLIPEGVREIVAAQGVKSILVIPIILRGEFWGFIGFDDCSSERFFSETEEQILQSGGILIVSSILRNQMVQNLIDARETALESTRAKSEFLSRMSHEIRTPMNAIIGMCSIARKTDDPDKMQYCLERIATSSNQMMEIINDILDMSKIEANKFEITNHEFDFEKAMQNVFSMIQVKVAEKRQNLIFDFDVLFTRNVISDELRLTQVLINLLNNAVKFTPEEGEIILRVRQSETESDTPRLRIDVVDNGIGISKEQQERLFTSFEQADGSITRRFGGTGLGLAICKKIVNLMGGEIWVESEEGKGSTFSFEIDIEWGAECAVDALKPISKSDLRILVADDSEDVRMYFSNILSTFNLDCDTASGGEEAIETAASALNAGRPYDIIFLDWRMPGVDGVESAKRIKSIMDDNIVVVMISVADWSDIEGEKGPVEVSRFLSKPILPSVLYNTIVELTEFRPQTESGGESAASANWDDRTILVAEDIEINREIISGILGSTNVSIEYAENGAKAVEMYERSGGIYDLILMDVQMPELDGLEATKRIRASDMPGAREIPIVAMTANAFKEDIMECISAGMNDHVAKPIDVESLIEKLSIYLG